jgi:hypothetical protein
MDNPEQLAAWVEWRERCELDRCGDDTRSRLRTWARSHARNKWSGTLHEQLAQAWHIFESHAVISGKRGGKQPKSSMFSVEQTDENEIARLQRLQAYAAKILFTALKNYALKEVWLRRKSGGSVEKLPMLSVDHPDAPSLDALAGVQDSPHTPENAVCRAEMEAAVRLEAELWFASLAQRERVALGAYFSGLPLTAPDVLTLAGCSKSQLYTAQSGAVRRLAEALQTKYGAEDGADRVRDLVEMVLYQVGNRCASEIFPENDTVRDS